MYYETNVNGTLNLLEACKDFGVKKFVLASTSSLYGANNPLPFREDADTSHPLSPYAASKKAAEVLCHTYHYLHGIDVTVLRYFTVYGPAGRPDMSLFRFVQGVIENRLITIYGDGKQLRDFTYVGDIARGTLAGLNRMGYEVINLGSDCPVNLMDVIELVENLVGCKAWTQFASRHASDVPATWADVRKAHGFLGWQPRTTFEDGVRDLVNWCRSNREWIKDIRTE
jgi:nucleoside-diphosphate-sugar epimerase